MMPFPPPPVLPTIVVTPVVFPTVSSPPTPPPAPKIPVVVSSPVPTENQSGPRRYATNSKKQPLHQKEHPAPDKDADTLQETSNMST